VANDGDYYGALSFAVRYPESWYNDITTSSRFYSLAATINSNIIGIIISEIKPRSRCNREVRMNVKACSHHCNRTELAAVPVCSNSEHVHTMGTILSAETELKRTSSKHGQYCELVL